MQIFHLKQCNEVEDGRVNITFHAARDASEVFSQTIKATPLDQFMTQFWRKRRGVNAHTYAHERWNGSPSGHGMHAPIEPRFMTNIC